MAEKKFLAYVLYITLLEIPENAYKNGDSRLFQLTDILHNIPLSLLEEQSAKDEFYRLLESVDNLKIPQWLNMRIKEFESRFPEMRVPKQNGNTSEI